MKDVDYSNQYRNIDFRSRLEKCRIGRGEQGVLIAEPYKSEILPYWRLKTPEFAKQSAIKIYAMFIQYGKIDNFVGMDMARKFLQMGFTHARHYANHKSGRKYSSVGIVLHQEEDWKDSEKARSAHIFFGYYSKAKDNATYLELKEIHKKRSKA